MKEETMFACATGVRNLRNIALSGFPPGLFDSLTSLTNLYETLCSFPLPPLLKRRRKILDLLKPVSMDLKPFAGISVATF